MRHQVTLSAVLALAALTGTSPASAGPKDAVVIESSVSFAEYPFQGEFVVTEGAAALGCSAGTTIEFFRSHATLSSITRTMTCTVGGTGTITINFYPLTPIPGPGDDNARWNIIDATGDFVGLHGQGASASYYAPDFSSAVATQTALIHYEP